MAWMRSGGLSARDWAVITEYVEVLRPLKKATERLEGRGKKEHAFNGRFGAIYEIIPTFEQLITTYEQRLLPYNSVDYEQPGAPEDHLAINLRAALTKLHEYHSKLRDSPAYYAAVVLHPRYKNYCRLTWSREQLETADEAFKQIWHGYNNTQVLRNSPPCTNPHTSVFDDAIDAILDADSAVNGVD